MRWGPRGPSSRGSSLHREDRHERRDGRREARVDEARDAALAEQLGLQRGCLVAVAHSGSRGLGTALARRYGDATLEGPAIQAYLADVAGACRFAQVNRFLLAYRMLRALGAARRLSFCERSVATRTVTPVGL